MPAFGKLTAPEQFAAFAAEHGRVVFKAAHWWILLGGSHRWMRWLS